MLETRFGLTKWEQLKKDITDLSGRYSFTELEIGDGEGHYLRMRQDGKIWGFNTNRNLLNKEDMRIMGAKQIMVFGRLCEVRKSGLEGVYIFSEK